MDVVKHDRSKLHLFPFVNTASCAQVCRQASARNPFPQGLSRSLPTSLQLHQSRCVCLIPQSFALLRTSHTTITTTGLWPTEVLHNMISRSDADHTIGFIEKDTKGIHKSAFMTYSHRNDSTQSFHLTLSLEVWIGAWFSSMRGVGVPRCPTARSSTTPTSDSPTPIPLGVSA